MKRIVLIPIPAVALLLLALDLFTPEKGPDNLDFGGVISDVFTHYQKTKTDKSSQNAVIKEKETSQYTGAQYERSDLIKPRGSVGEPREAHRRTSNALDETSPPTQIGEYFRLYGERELSLLASDATNLNLEAVKHAGDWKRAGDWDNQGFLRMQETFKDSLDLASAPAVPDFQVPAVQMPFQVPAVQMPFQVPAVQMPFQVPAVQAPAFQVSAFQVPALQAPTFRAPAFQAPAFQVPAFQVPAVPTCCVAP